MTRSHGRTLSATENRDATAKKAAPNRKTRALPPPSFGKAAEIFTRYAIHGVEQADAVASEPQEWFWKGYIAAESYVLFAGRPGVADRRVAQADDEVERS